MFFYVFNMKTGGIFGYFLANLYSGSGIKLGFWTRNQFLNLNFWTLAEVCALLSTRIVHNKI